MILSLTSVIAAALLAAGEPSATDVRQWPLGFRVVEVAALPMESWWSGWRFDSAYEVSGDASTLEISCAAGDGFCSAWVRVWLSHSGVRATAGRHSCTDGWSGRFLTGTACLATDGQSAVLDFEIHDGGSLGLGEAQFGRVLLGARGAELALRVARSDARAPLRRERVEFADRGADAPTHEASGLVDAFGRRQGLWSVRALGVERPTLELSWRDGFPDGVWRRLDGENSLLEVGVFHAGLRHGEEVSSDLSGARYVSEWRDGTRVRWTRFAFDGRKTDERSCPDDDRELPARIAELHTRR